MKQTLLFCTGDAGSGKTTFINDYLLPDGLFYNLRSATTRGPRGKETDGNPYFFRDEAYFDTEPLITHLWVNEKDWQPGQPKWLYGVPESEVWNNLGRNFVYDVIEPRYVREMIDWFYRNDLDMEYAFKIAWFIPTKQSMETVDQRATMPNDRKIREQNTCSISNLLDCDLRPDFILRPRAGNNDPRLFQYIGALYENMKLRQPKPQNLPHSK